MRGLFRQILTKFLPKLFFASLFLRMNFFFGFYSPDIITFPRRILRVLLDVGKKNLKNDDH